MSLHQQICGSGEATPLVMLHGWAMHSGVWRTFAHHLAQRRRVIAVDLPGHGASPALPFTWPVLREALHAIMPQEPTICLGWSLGAMAAIDYATHYPRQVAALILITANPRFVASEDWPGLSLPNLHAMAEELCRDAPAVLRRFWALQVHGMSDAPRHLQHLHAVLTAYPPPTLDTLRQGLVLLRDADLRPQFASLPMPVLTLFGGRDKLVPKEVMAALCALRPSTDAQLLPRAGHIPFITHESDVLAQIQRFLSRYDVE